MQRRAAIYTVMVGREIIASWRLLPEQIPTPYALVLVGSKLFRAIRMENSILYLTPDNGEVW